MAVVARGIVGWNKEGARNLAKRIEKELDGLNEKLEAHWYLRLRVAEIKDGDLNTTYFHHKASQRKKQNKINGIYDYDIWKIKAEEIENEVETYFRKIFSSNEPSHDDIEEVSQHVKSSICLSIMRFY